MPCGIKIDNKLAKRIYQLRNEGLRVTDLVERFNLKHDTIRRICKKEGGKDNEIQSESAREMG